MALNLDSLGLSAKVTAEGISALIIRRYSAP
ncbi:Uncharacterised protein [Escherichia coli]|uniref:Uncharacterized protein n=1 Tax=Escherichia coli TaxID=562 RepID=A0A377A2V8_ECOLX|nr:Uncharacterised protein [Escherichia coli]